MDIKEISVIFQGLLAPVVAVIASYIAYQQWRTNEVKLQLDLYDRRLKIYEEVKRVLLLVVRDGDIKYEELSNFAISVSEADFLFGNEIREYIDEVYRRGVKLSSFNRQYNHVATTNLAPAGYNHQRVCDGINEESLWFSSQFEPTRKMFSTYLKIKSSNPYPPK